MKEYLKEWYSIVFRDRIVHKENKISCYIFKTEKEKEEYLKENGIELRENKKKYYGLASCWGKDGESVYYSEESIPNLIAVRIKNVYLMSSEVPETIEEICKKAIADGYDVCFYKK